MTQLGTLSRGLMIFFKIFSEAHIRLAKLIYKNVKYGQRNNQTTENKNILQNLDEKILKMAY